MNASIQRRVIFMALALLLSVGLASCGGGLGTTAGGGIGGTGIGPVTGFGSVIVNGVHYDDTGIDSTNFFDDHGRTKADLKSGMMVAISGSINGANGTANSITVLRHVDGPMDDNGVDLATNRLKVMGQDVVVDASTVFDNGIANITDLRTLQGANVSHPELEVHGSSDDNGVIHATFIYKWANDNVTGRRVQVRGPVAAPLTSSTFVIGRKTVNFGSVPGGLPAGVTVGKFVEVTGILNPVDNVLSATSVKLDDATGAQPSGSRMEIEGYVVPGITPGVSFDLLGPNGVQTVTWSTGTTAFTGGTGADIGAGVKVEVEGTRKVGGNLAATKIDIRRNSNILMESSVTSVTTSSLTIFGKTVTVNSLTQYKDSRDSLKTFGQASITVNDSLQVSAYVDNSTAPASIVATRVERVGAIGANNHVLQGPVDSALSPNLVILGITVVTTPSTTFLRADETAFATQANFFAAVATGGIVKARGNQATPIVIMNADEVQIEPTLDD